MTQGLVVDVVGWAGALMLLAAYGAVSSRRLEATSHLYQGLNAVGSVGLIINCVYYWALPSAFVNLVWIGIAVSAMVANRAAARRRE